ncbi:MAG: sensor histidine kinase [Frankiales bacterium]|nr:sensor histidine kinase [Frankiales bacterium]
MSRATTLRGRLALVAVVTTAVWVGLLTAGFNVILGSQLHAQSGSLLRQQAAAAAATVVVSPDGSVRLSDPKDDEILDADLWIYAGRTALERPRASARLQARADALAGVGERLTQVGSTRLYALPVPDGRRQAATVVSAVSLEPYRNVARIALLGSIGLSVLLLAGMYAATRLLVGRALAPVQEMSAQAARWSEADAAQRFGAADRPAELAILARNLDGVLDRLAGLLRHEQQVTEELSHELRTPLSLITAETDLLSARRRTTAETDTAVQVIAQGAAHMQRILETLLSAARSRSFDTQGRCDLRAAVDAAVRLTTAAAMVHVSSQGAAIAAGVDADVVERMLGPLLDNAGRYARSRIDVQIRSEGGWSVVRVADDGPGVDPALGEAVFDPGRRDAKTSPYGSGLGLALARRLARAAGGELLLTDGVFELRLPRV